MTVKLGAKLKTRLAKLPKRAKEITIKTLDDLARKVCQLRRYCEGDRKHTNVLQWAHICSRRYLGIRWREDNCFLLCSACHWYYTLRPIEWENFCIAKLGEVKYNALRQEALTVHTPRGEERKEIARQLRARLESEDPYRWPRKLEQAA